MAGSKGKASSTPAAKGRPKRQAAVLSTPHAQDIYHEMLSEAASASDTQGSERPLKRRKTAQPKSVPRSKNAAQDDAHDNASQTDDTHVPSTLRQTVYDDSEDSEESDVDWEEIGLRQHSPEEEQSTNEAGIKDVSVVIGASEAAAKRSRPSKRRAPTAIEKKVRLEIHKVHVLCLLAHVFIRNSWCNDLLAQLALKRLLPPRTVSYLTLDANVSQFQRDRSFNDALQEAHDIFRVKFDTTALGLRKAHWAESDNDLQHTWWS
ncbi:hypothetical protein LTR39_005097 [Cryomyces antarcticus]|nr:hypothetical protein LTR39_005097 [Cryomyces antarcticus]